MEDPRMIDARTDIKKSLSWGYPIDVWNMSLGSRQSFPPRRFYCWFVCMKKYLWTDYVHLIDYPDRSKHNIVVIISQSQLHNVNGSNAWGNLSIRSLSSTLKDSRMKTVLSVACRNLKDTFIRISQKMRTIHLSQKMKTIHLHIP